MFVCVYVRVSVYFSFVIHILVSNCWPPANIFERPKSAILIVINWPLALVLAVLCSSLSFSGKEQRRFSGCNWGITNQQIDNTKKTSTIWQTMPSPSNNCSPVLPTFSHSRFSFSSLLCLSPLSSSSSLLPLFCSLPPSLFGVISSIFLRHGDNNYCIPWHYLQVPVCNSLAMQILDTLCQGKKERRAK